MDMPTTKCLERWFGAVWLTLVVVIPLAFNPYSRRVFEPEKAFVLRLVAFLFIILWTLRLSTGQLSGETARCVPAWQQPRIRASIAALCLGFVTLLATLTSVAPRISWSGSYEWRQGALTFLACLVVFLAAAWQPQPASWQTWLVTAIELTSLMVAGYGVLQYVGFDPLPWQPTAGGRAFSTLGHPNFLAAYLVLVVPIVGVRLLSAIARPARSFHAVVLGVGLLCLYLTFSRSGWLGLLVAIGFLVALQIKWSPRRNRWWGVMGFSIVVLLATIWLAYLDPAGLFSQSPLEPVHSFLRGKSATIQVRALTWAGAWELIRQKPVLGFGPETFRLVFPQVFPPLLSIYGGSIAAGDHAHNELLDWAMTTGFLGLAAYVFWFATVMRMGIRSLPRLEDRTSRTLLMGLMAAMLGYTVQNQFSFSTTAPMSCFWLIAGWVVAISHSASAPSDEAENFDLQRIGTSPKPAWWTRAAMMVGGLELAAALLVAALIPHALALWADVHAQMAWSATRTGEWDQAATRYAEALRLQRTQDRYWRFLAETYSAQAVSDPQHTAEAFLLAESALQEAIALSPLDMDYRLALGRLFYAWGVAGERDRLLLATDAYRQAAAMSSSDPQVWSEWGRTYQALGQLTAAIEKYDRALELNPLHVQTYNYLGQTYLALGRTEEARVMFDKVGEATAELDRLVSKR